MKPRFISKAPWAQTSKLAHIPRSLPTGRRVPCDLDTHVLFTDASLTPAEEDKEYLVWKAEKERQKKEKEALEMAQTNAQLNAQRSVEMIRQVTPMYVSPRVYCL
jgi:hypothetical protein